jgi:hypothetical protein
MIPGSYINELDRGLLVRHDFFNLNLPQSRIHKTDGLCERRLGFGPGSWKDEGGQGIGNRWIQNEGPLLAQILFFWLSGTQGQRMCG